MISDFLLLFSQLNQIFLSSQKRKKIIKKYGLLETKLVEIFKYEKNNNGQQNKPKLYIQVVSKVLLIANMLYPRYSFLFLFDNVISHLVYAKNLLQVQKINKNTENK